MTRVIQNLNIFLLNLVISYLKPSKNDTLASLLRHSFLLQLEKNFSPRFFFRTKKFRIEPMTLGVRVWEQVYRLGQKITRVRLNNKTLFNQRKITRWHTEVFMPRR
uniref:Uncharacterized protein n=1 Tax=Cacopsylla melanoneura TaxID=428564 RepID=A0A8D8WM94_9HEMI